ncbi:MAG: hypothetical protein ABIQ55_00380 [Gemmatimonadaceae bacterium]
MKTGLIESKVWYAILICLYALLTIVFFVFPVLGHFGEVLLGTGTYRHDAVLNAGILEWGYRSIWSSDLRLFDWPPGFPLRGTLAATENLVGWQLFYSPLRAFGASVAASYNVALLSSLVISAAGCAALSQRLGSSRVGAGFGGIVFAFNPFHVDHMIHLQTMAVCWSPLALLGLDMALETGSIRGLMTMAVSIVMTVLSGMYFGVFLALILPTYAILCWLTGRHPFSVSTSRAILVACLISAVIISPILRPYLSYMHAYGRYPHSGAEVLLSALSLRSLLQTPFWLGSWRSTMLATTDTGGFASAFPGVVTLGLALVAVFRRQDKPSRQITLAIAALACVCLVLALGPTLLLRRGQPVRGVAGLPLPGKIFLLVTAVRWPMRIYMYSVLSMGILAALGITQWLGATRSRRRPLLFTLLLGVLLVELRPSKWFIEHSARVTNPTRMSDAYSFLAREKNRGGVVELPIKMDSGLATPFATRYAYGSAGHLRGVIAFHGSMFPPLLDSLRRSTYDLPRPEALALMEKNGVTRLLIHNDLMSVDSSNILVRSLLARGYPIVFRTNNSVVFSLSH